MVTTLYSLRNWVGEGLRQTLLFPAMRQRVPLQVSGLENLGNGPYIFAANHSSHLDTPILLQALPLQLRLQTRVAAAYDYFFTSRCKGLALQILLNVFPFVRKGPGAQDSLQQATELLAAGQSLLIFPEGTRTADGQIHRFKLGIARLATTSKVQVVPVWIDGTYAAMPRGTNWPCHQAIRVTFGEPVSFIAADPTALTPASLKVVTQAIENRIRAMVGQQNVKAA